MYKSKKQNYPGLYGKFKRIDSSNFDDEQQKHKRPEYSNDANLENLDDLIRTIKEKTQEYAEPIITNTITEPVVKSDKKSKVKSVHKSKNYDSELDQLKKSSSILNTVYSIKNKGDEEENGEDELFSKLITDSDFIDDLEEDMLDVSSTTHFSYDFPEIEIKVNELLDMLDSLSSSERGELVKKEYISYLLKKLNR